MSVTIPMGNRLADAMDWVYDLLTGWTHRWDAAHYFVQRWNNLYYVPRSWLFPYNRLVVRNVPRTYSDPVNRLPHAMFSLLCEYVEREYGPRRPFDEYVADARKSVAEYEAWKAAGNDGYPPNSMYGGYAVAVIELSDLYYWYKGINWDDPVGTPRDDAPQPEWDSWCERLDNLIEKDLPAKCKHLIDNMGAMWT